MKKEETTHSKTEKKKPHQSYSENPMRKIEIEKIVLSIGGTGDDLERGVKLLKFLTGRKPCKIKSRKRIPTWGVRPGLEVGTMLTIRKNLHDFLNKMLGAVDNKVRKKQITSNAFSFGIKEYIEIPGTEYQRDIGIMGFDVTIVFKRAGRRVRLKKMKRGKVPKRQVITKEEIIKFMEEKFHTQFTGKG